MIRNSCAFTDCAFVDECGLVGGCFKSRGISMRASKASGLRADAPALNGTEPRPVRDPALIKRKRKALTK